MSSGGPQRWRPSAAAAVAVAPLLLAACSYDWTRQSAPNVELAPTTDDDAGTTPSPDAGTGGGDAGGGHPNDAGPPETGGPRITKPGVTAWIVAGTVLNGQTMQATEEVMMPTGEPVSLGTNLFDSQTFLTISTQEGPYQETACVVLGFQAAVRTATAVASRLDDSRLPACPDPTSCHEVDVFAFLPGGASAGGYQHLSRDDVWQTGNTTLAAALPEGTTGVMLCPWRPTQLGEFAGVLR